MVSDIDTPSQNINMVLQQTRAEFSDRHVFDFWCNRLFILTKFSYLSCGLFLFCDFQHFSVLFWFVDYPKRVDSDPAHNLFYPKKAFHSQIARLLPRTHTLHTATCIPSHLPISEGKLHRSNKWLPSPLKINRYFVVIRFMSALSKRNWVRWSNPNKEFAVIWYR